MVIHFPWRSRYRDSIIHVFFIKSSKMIFSGLNVLTMFLRRLVSLLKMGCLKSVNQYYVFRFWTKFSLVFLKDCSKMLSLFLISVPLIEGQLRPTPELETVPAGPDCTDQLCEGREEGQFQPGPFKVVECDGNCKTKRCFRCIDQDGSPALIQSEPARCVRVEVIPKGK